MKLHGPVLEEVVERSRRWSGFTEKNAGDALTLVQGFVEALAGEGVRVEGPGDRGLLLLAMDMALIIWLDDRFDSARQVDLGALLRAAGGAPDTPEAEALVQVRSLVEPAARDERAYRWWLDTLVATCRAYSNDQAFSRGRGELSLAEYLENGENSIAVPHLAATLSLVCGLDLAERAAIPAFQRTVAHLSRVMRLRNDLASVEKERIEGDRANAVLLVEALMPAGRATRFVGSLMREYGRLLARDLDPLDDGDALRRIAATLLGVTERFYAVPRERYSRGERGEA